MKKIFTLITAALVTLTSFADHRDGKITITDFSNKQLLIEVDEIRYNNRGREFVIDDLRPGYHRVQVYSLDRRNFGWGDIFDRRGRKQVLYNATILVKPRQNICLTINRFSQVEIDERRFNDGNKRDRDNDWGRNRDKDYDRDKDDNRNGDHNRDRDDRDNRDNRYDNTRGGMDIRSFEMLKNALSRESFERSRLEIAKQTIDRNSFSAGQVREMALLFAFETNKLELAKYAYRNTVDRNNYFQLYDVFSFSSSKEELAEYIRRFR